MEGSTVKKRESGRGASWKSYIPLFVVIALALLAAGAKQIHYEAGDFSVFMRDFMGFFLVEFSMLKFFNLKGFADGFQMYDLLAKRSRIYAYFYPFIELGLGLAFLTSWRPDVVFGATIVVMVFDILTKSLGSTNPHNMVRATMAGLTSLVSARQVARERGVELDQIAYKPRQGA
jgi:hypothetical protein